MSAPFDIRNLSRPIVWTGALGEAALNTICAFIGGSQQNAVWTTGRAYMGTTEVPIWAGLLERTAYALSTNTLIAAAEESVFRGIIFEEIKEAWGVWPARLIDMTLFAAAHIPNLISKHVEVGNAITQILWIFLDTFLIDSAYLDGGLPESIALHCNMNVFNRLLDWAFGAGAPAADIFDSTADSSAGSPTKNASLLTFSFSIPY